MISQNTKIEIRPIPGRNGIKQFSENLEYFSQSYVIGAFVNPKTLKYDTGLSEDDIKYLQDKKFPYDISDTWVKGKAHPFWESNVAKMELTANPIFLYPGKNLIDFVKYKYLLVSKYVYKSEAEMASGIKPQATHYIYNDEEEIKIKASKLERTNKLIRNISDLSLARKRDIVLILLNENTENKNDDYLTVAFDRILQDPDKMKELEEILSKDADELNLIATIKSAIQKNVLRQTKKGIFLFESNLGFSLDDVKDFLSKAENQEILLTIKQKL